MNGSARRASLREERGRVVSAARGVGVPHRAVQQLGEEGGAIDQVEAVVGLLGDYGHARTVRALIVRDADALGGPDPEAGASKADPPERSGRRGEDSPTRFRCREAEHGDCKSCPTLPADEKADPSHYRGRRHR